MRLYLSVAIGLLVKKRGKREDVEGGTERSVHNAAVFERESCEI